MALIKLNKDQYKATNAALCFAFGNYNQLKLMLRTECDQILRDIAADGALPEVVDLVIERAEQEGWIDPLIRGALAARPNNPKLRELAPVLLLTSTGTPSEALQSLIMPNNQLQDVEAWRAGMATVESYVCRFKAENLRDGNADVGIASGFLVAPDVVMTNFHVVAQLQQAAVTAPAVQFGFRKSIGGEVTAEEEIPLAGENWVIGSSPVAELDYALIRLAHPSTRPLLPTPKPWPYTPGDVYFMLQHPRGAPMKMGSGTMTVTTAAPPRVRYTTNSEPGSSGSPVFSMGWAPIALHRAGMNLLTGEMDNSGVPMMAVFDHAMAAGTWPTTTH